VTNADWWLGVSTASPHCHMTTITHTTPDPNQQPNALPPKQNYTAVLLLQALERWRAERGGAPPGSSAERSAFKQQVAAMRRRGPEGVPLDVRWGVGWGW